MSQSHRTPKPTHGRWPKAWRKVWRKMFRLKERKALRQERDLPMKCFGIGYYT